MKQAAQMGKRRLGMVVAMIVGVSVVQAQFREQAGQTVTGFRVPDYDQNNNLKSQLFGDFAKILPNGVIEITGLKIDFYQDGEVGMTITAPHCKYNQREAVAESDSDVRIERENMVVTGVGFLWRGKKESLEIRQNAKVVLRDVRRQMDTGVKE